MPVEWANFIFTVIAGFLAAIWGFWVWRGERNKEREQERKKRAALYVNPFLMACEDLQSRLYNILENNGLKPLREHCPDGSYADETLYLVAQYFAWEWCIYRYSPYAQDSDVIQLTEEIRLAYGTDKLEIGPFCFFRHEQRSLGRLVRERHEGEFGAEFDVISFSDFKQRLALPPLSDSKAIRETLSALRDAQSKDDLKPSVRKRMARIQTKLVSLLNHIERKEGITLFHCGDAKKRLTAKDVEA